ncbi:MAG: uroporphyrinogen decarboxylase [bacterium]|nr:uroporphyrinogen decarboxylase [bacterium]
MTNKERVIASLNHKQSDRIPYALDFTVGARVKMVEFYNDTKFESKLDNCIYELDTAKPNTGKMVTSDIWEDEFGVQWDRTIDKDIGTVCNCIVTPENISSYAFPELDCSNRFKHYRNNIARNSDKFVLAGINFSLFERAWALAGMENMLMNMLMNPDFVNNLLDCILEYNLQIIDSVCDYDIDGMRFGDDWGQQTGLIMGPKLWREFLKPRLQRMYAEVKSKGKRVFIHSCGKVDEIFPDLIEIGVDVFNPFQPEVMDVYDMKKKYGDKLSFWGGISTQKTLPYGSVNQIKDETRQLMKNIGKDGGYIVAPAHCIPGDAKPENIAAMIEVLNNQ